MSIHPKTSGAAVGGALGVLIVAVLHSLHGVHLTPEAAGSIPSFLSLLGAWLVPGQVSTATAPVERGWKLASGSTPEHLTGPTAPVE